MEYLLIIIYMAMIFASSQIPPGSPVITGPQVIVLNSQITFQCTSPRGSPTPTVKWFSDDTEITTGVFTTTAGIAVTTSFTFTATLDDHLEVVECQAENGVLQNPLTTTKYIEVHFSPESPTWTGPTTLTPGQQGIWTCSSANGYPAGIMTMRNENKNTQFTSEFTSTSVLDQKSYDVTGTLTWSPVIVNNGDTICCDVTHTTTLGNTPQTVCRQIKILPTPPVTSIQQLSYNQMTGQQIILGCTVSSPNSSLQEVQWTLTNNEGQVTDPILVSTSNGKYSGSTISSPSLTINNVASTDEGTYSCKARNLVGTSTNNPTTTFTLTRNNKEENILIYLVIGIVAVLLLLILIFSILCYRRGFKQGQEKQKEDVSNTYVSQRASTSNQLHSTESPRRRDHDRNYDGLDPDRQEMHVYNTTQDNEDNSHYMTLPADHAYIDPIG